MAIVKIPTEPIPQEIVDALPKNGKENIVYRRLVEDEELREMQVTDDFIWNDGKWLPFSYDAVVNSVYFGLFQDSIVAEIENLKKKISDNKELE